jgi:adenylate cyclase
VIAPIKNFWKKLLRDRRLGVDILSAFSALLGVAVACEILYASYANKKLILDFEKEYYSKTVAKTATNLIDEQLRQLELVLKVLAKNFHNNQSPQYGSLFLESLKSLPYTLSFYVAMKNGTYFQARTLDGITTFQNSNLGALPSYAKFALRAMQRNNQTGQMVESWDYLNEDLGSIAKESLPSALYNATKRDWYMKAEMNKGAVWSDVYLFKTTKTAGMTLSMPLGYNDDSTATGVIAVDFAIKQFKDLLDSIKITKESKTYLISNKNEIIASSTNMKTFKITNDSVGLTLISVSSTDDLALEEAAKHLLGTDSRHASFEVNKIGYVASVQKLTRIPCSLLIISPQNDFVDCFSTVQRDMLLLSIFVFFFSIVMILLLSRRISRPITELCYAAKKIGEMDLSGEMPLPDSDILEIKELATAMQSMKLGVATFSKYAPRDLVTRLIREGMEPELGGETKNITLFFSDIEKFSTVSEKLPAEYLILHLSEYFDEITKEIMRNNGVIDKYIGDSVMAIWGAPNRDDDQVVNACYAALGSQKLLKKLEKKWLPLGKPALPTRIGLHTGAAIVGNIGSNDRMNFTAIGSAVDIASRLEGANKFYGTKILASEDVERVARGRVLFRVIDKVAVKGKSIGIVIYEPLSTMGEDSEYYSQIQLCAKTKEAFELYLERNFEKAIAKYKRIVDLFPEAERSITPLIERCSEYSKDPPPDDWDGTFHLTQK